MRVCDVLAASSVAVHVTLDTKQDALKYMIHLLDRRGMIEDVDRVQDEIFKRETLMSTGVGKGFAFPHAKTGAVQKPSGALITLDHPIEYQSLDNQPVSIIFMLLGQEHAVGAHLRLLSRISRLMNNDEFRQKLLEARSPDEVLNLINEEETQKLDV
jgi:fructose-specific phosphotransferase system IIA component